jgi:hypothetical protein
MQALKIISALITSAALGISSAWAQDEDSFEAVAELNTYKLIPPALSNLTGKVTLTFVRSIPPTEGTPTTEAIIAQAPEGDPWADIDTPQNQTLPGSQVTNARLYFGQYFTNGRPIATLCDENIPSMKCNCGGEGGEGRPTCRLPEGRVQLIRFSDIKFHQGQLLERAVSDGESALIPFELVDSDRRLSDGGQSGPQHGFDVLKDLIERGLIYVVINSPYDAVMDPDREDAVIKEYELPNCNSAPGVFCITPEGDIRTDGDLRGTLRLASQNEVLRRLSEISTFLGL